MKKYELLINDNNLLDTINSDYLKRNNKLINFIRLLNNINENFIISIDGEWGSGKTFFVNQLQYIRDNYNNIDFIKNNEDYLLEAKKFSTKYIPIYYNAWENDNHDDPLSSLIFNFLNEYPKFQRKPEKLTEEIFETIFPILKKIIVKKVNEYCDCITEDCFNNVKTFCSLAESIYTIEEKKTALNELFDKITDNDERILLIVDEVDRCCPDYAVKLLETLKHFYDNPNLTIVIATNNKQLSYTIKKYYGNDFDGYGYLNKIYDTVIKLEVDNIENYSEKYCEINKSDTLDGMVSIMLFKYLRFSYRECNRYTSMYNIVKRYRDYKSDFASNNNKFVFCSNVLLPITLALKIKDIDKYNNFVSGNGEDIMKSFIGFIENLNDKSYIDWLYYIIPEVKKEKLIDIFIEKYNVIDIEKTDVVNYICFHYF